MRPAGRAAALLALVAAVAAGCGGGDSDGGARLEAEAAGAESESSSSTTEAPSGSSAGSSPESSSGSSTTTTGAASGGGAPTGEEVYRRNCASCHGETGGGGFGPSMVGVADRLALEDHVAVVRDGRGRMPAWASSLSPEEIEAVVDYQRTALSEPSS
jgi:cytochrome c5